jgi:DnaJ-class molecular chaperone
MTADHDQDLYLVLGVDPSASASQITHAYRTLMRRHHPDTRHPPATATRLDPAQDPSRDHDTALQRIAAAYTVLRDPRRRADYDAGRAAQARHDQDRPGRGVSEPSRRVPRHTGPPVILGEAAGGYQPRPTWIAIR